MRKIVFSDRELKRLGGHYINETPSLLFIVLVSFLCFCAKRLFTVYVFGEFFFHSVHFWWIFLQCTFWWIFSMLGYSFQLFTHSKNSLQYQFDNSHSVLHLLARGILGLMSAKQYCTIPITYHNIQIQSVWEGGTNVI